MVLNLSTGMQKIRLLIIFLLIAVSCKNDEETQAPFITGLTPTQDVPGATVVLTGGNFSAAAGGNIVLFNGIQAEVTSATATQITTIVPVGPEQHALAGVEVRGGDEQLAWHGAERVGDAAAQEEIRPEVADIENGIGG